ncbi:MAG TPA: ATP-binding protein [Anaeromyxobacter sp.]|nr:ATP-binding protein [Anaeromyxobacter sp.]
MQVPASPEPEGNARAPGGSAAPATARARILIVDDRPENLVALESVLRSPEHDLVLASSGAEALRYLLHEGCALILLDVQMPELDGFETARLVHGNPRTRSIPIIFMTAVSREESFVARGYQAGAVDYIVKPIEPDVLRAKVAALVELHRGRDEALKEVALTRERERAERQQALEQLELRALRRERSASERYRRLVDGISHAIVFSLDPITLACTLVSQSSNALLGRGREDWMRDPTAWQELLPAADRSRFAAAVRAAQDGRPVTVDHGLLRKDGLVARFRTELCLLPADEDGAPELRGFSVDVTETRQAEEVLEFLARAGAELAGSLELTETLRCAAALAVPFLADRCEVSVWLGERELRASAPREEDGEPPTSWRQPRHEMVVPLRVRRRELGRMRLLRRQPPTLREMRLAEELARRAGQHLDNAVLYGEAREAVRLRDEFISVASHELRTPLTSLTLQVKVLQRWAAEPALQDAQEVLPGRLANVSRQVERLNRLVANLLDVTRLRVGRLELALEEFDLCGLVEEVAGRFSDELARGGRRIEVELARPVPGRWDRVRLEQVLTNLLSNAIRYGAGPVEVSVARAGEGVRLRVRDHGTGIGPEEQARIFDRYERGRASGGGGLGLGLYLVRLFVEAHGGAVALESGEGEGACFTVSLPLCPPEADGSEEAQRETPASGDQPVDGPAAE